MNNFIGDPSNNIYANPYIDNTFPNQQLTIPELGSDPVVYLGPDMEPPQQFPQDVTYMYEPMRVIFGQENFASIEQIAPQLLQLHIYGEIFSENGFVVRSDARSKNSISFIKDALDKVLKVFCCTFRYKNDASLRCGVLAQQLQEIDPVLVHTDINGTLSIDLIALIPMVVEALKTLKTTLSTTIAQQTEKIQEAEKAVKNAIDIVQKQQRTTDELTFTLGSVWVTLPLSLLFVISAIILCLMFQELPFMLLSVLVSGVMCVVSISQVPKHVKRGVTKEINNILQSDKKKLTKLGTKLTRNMVEEFKLNIAKWIDDKEFTNYQKSMCISYFALININLCAIAISFIYGESLIRFFGIYIAIALLCWGISIRCYDNLSFYQLFKFFLGFFLVASILCAALIQIQPTLHCELDGFEKHNIIDRTQTDSLQLLLTTSLPWNCMNPTLKSTPQLPNFHVNQTFSKLVMSGEVDNVPPHFQTTVYLLCSGFIKFECGTFSIE
ncbi:Peptidase S74 domain-containing protein [Entamoeba marina]